MFARLGAVTNFVNFLTIQFLPFFPALQFAMAAAFIVCVSLPVNLTSSLTTQFESVQLKEAMGSRKSQYMEKQNKYATVTAAHKGVMPFTENLKGGIAENLHVNTLCKQRRLKEALHHLDVMKQRGIRVHPGTYGSLLQLCVELRSLTEGRRVRDHIVRDGIEPDTFLGNHLINMYSKLGEIKFARECFEGMSEQNLVSWSSMIAGYAQNGHCQEALQTFCAMLLADFKPNQFVFASILRACSNPLCLEPGKQVYAYTIKSGCSSDMLLGSAIVNMFVKCGNIPYSRVVFDNLPERTLISWTAMIVGYAQNGKDVEALRLFCKMQLMGIELDQFVFSTVLRVCGSLSDLGLGKQIHVHVIKSGFNSDVSAATPLVDMYAKCSNVQDARKVFDSMSERNVVSWCAMMAGYAEIDYGDEVLKLFGQMQRAGVKPNQFIFSIILRACAILAAHEQGKQVHANLIKTGLMSDLCGGSALVSMYARSGSIEDAQFCFDIMTERDVVTWTAMIVGHAHHGQAWKALELFEQMQSEGIKPNHITFVGVLSACSHVGLINEGWQYFESMSRDHNIAPTVDHYACMVDILGRAGLQAEAENLINQMPFKPNALVWRTLLGTCRIHGNIELGKRAAECILELEPEDDATYVLLSNMNASAGNWDEVTKIRKMMTERGIKKEVGQSWIVVKNRVHTFVVGDRSHPQTEDIYTKLDELRKEMIKAGYVPDTNFVLHDVEEEQKEHLVFHHSEKLAIAFGLIRTPPGSTILIFKNLRVCGDCHTATKFISEIVMREIVVRDANRFHHFKGGVCSCNDYW